MILVTLLVGAIVSVLAVAISPIDTASAFSTREGGACDGCHTGAQTPSMLTVSGLPSGTYVPGQQYTITVTITDSNGAGTGQNNFDIIASAGAFSSPDANTEVNSATEASAHDAVDHTTLTSGTVVWTAPTAGSGSVSIEVWAVMGDGLSGTVDIWDSKSYSYTEIPEFSILIVPLVGIVAVVVLAARAMKK